MADQVKRGRSRPPLVGDRVSVPTSHFGAEFAAIVREKYQVEKILGTVKFKLSGKARIEWDSDGKTSEVAFEELLIEDKELAKQEFGGIVCNYHCFSFISLI